MPETIAVVRHALLALLLVGSAATDLRRRLILNALTYPACLAGLLLHSLAGPAGAWSAVAGMATCAGAVYPLCLAGGMGWGDLKLLAAVGALAGLRTGAAALVDAALCGGALALGVAAVRGKAMETMRRSAGVPANVWRSLRPGGRPLAGGRSRRETIPYGLAIAAGTAVAWLSRWPW